ncbi:MAG: hypothetical protein U9R79_03055 [Armatimonadota bacterium]|nr:hypothetical protein [Armatimonadota bacterium]
MTSDAGPDRVRAIVAVGAAAAVAITVPLYVLGHSLVALGFIGGALTGAGMLSALVFVLSRLVVPPGQRKGPTWPYWLLHAGKFLMAGAFAYLIILVLHGDVIAFAGGYTLALVVLLVVAAGWPLSSAADANAHTNVPQ